MAAWWAEDAHGEREAGGTVKVRFTNNGQEIGAMEMKLSSLFQASSCCGGSSPAPPNGSALHARFALKQEGDYCIVLFTHEGWKERVEFTSHCSTKWAVFLMSLKALLETGKGQPNPHDVRIDNWN